MENHDREKSFRDKAEKIIKIHELFRVHSCADRKPFVNKFLYLNSLRRVSVWRDGEKSLFFSEKLL